MTDNAPLVLICFGPEFVALTPTELAAARDRAREILGAGWAGDRAAAASTQSPEKLLTASEIAEATPGIPSTWYLERATFGDPARAARAVRPLSARRGGRAWGRDAADNRVGGQMGPEEARRGGSVMTSVSSGGAWTTCSGCGWAGGPFGYSIREVWIRSLFGPPYLVILPLCPVCGARVPRR